ncbi:MAG TPA: FecR domain-containing protein [Pedobacter sp.]|nr:FecR domain-containing protein [Pedobacter sp.]
MERSDINQAFQSFINGDYTEEDLALVLSAVADGTLNDGDLTRCIERLSEEEVKDQELVQHIANNVERELMLKVRPTKVRKMYFLRYAAAILIVLGIGIYRYAAQPVILAGKNSAVLTFDDGQEIALKENAQGFVNANGQIAYADGTAIRKDDKVLTAKLATPRAGQYKVMLDDGTKVYLNAASVLSYPTRFVGATREVTLEGEAYFEVAKNPQKPFIVHVQQQKIQVLGTLFNVNAYSNERFIKTTLVEGSVAVSESLHQNKATLKPSQQAIWDKGTSLTVVAVDPSEYTAWINGEIMLSSVELPEILRQLERWYDVTFEDVPANLPTKTVFGVLDRTLSLKEILNTLEKNYGVKFKINGRRVAIEVL